MKVSIVLAIFIGLAYFHHSSKGEKSEILRSQTTEQFHLQSECAKLREHTEKQYGRRYPNSEIRRITSQYQAALNRCLVRIDSSMRVGVDGVSYDTRLFDAQTMQVVAKTNLTSYPKTGSRYGSLGDRGDAEYYDQAEDFIERAMQESR
jgi:hypothetical protein